MSEKRQVTMPIDKALEHLADIKAYVNAHTNDPGCEIALGMAISALRPAPEANEPLTCEGCVHKVREGWNYELCVRCRRHWRDNYCRSPDGGEG